MPIPTDFSARTIRTHYVDAHDLLRIFRTPPGNHPAPVHYGTSATKRFDCPKGAGSFGVAYAAFDLATCFAETIVREGNRKPLLRGGIPVSESAEIHPRFVAHLRASRLLRLADMTDLGLYALGAEAGEFNSVDYALHTQPWALEIHSRGEQVDGLLYRSRFLNGRTAVAIFDRGGMSVSLDARSVTPLTQHAQYGATLTELGVLLLP
jgi:hypothetical protein